MIQSRGNQTAHDVVKALHVIVVLDATVLRNSLPTVADDSENKHVEQHGTAKELQQAGTVNELAQNQRCVPHLNLPTK